MDCVVAATASAFACARHHVIMDQVRSGSFDQGLRLYGLHGCCHSVGVCLQTYYVSGRKLEFDQGFRSYGLRGRCYGVGVRLGTPPCHKGSGKKRVFLPRTLMRWTAWLLPRHQCVPGPLITTVGPAGRCGLARPLPQISERVLSYPLLSLLFKRPACQPTTCLLAGVGLARLLHQVSERVALQQR